MSGHLVYQDPNNGGDKIAGTGNPFPTQLINNNAQGASLVTTSDSTDLTKVPTKGLYLGVSGDVKVTLNDGSTVTFVGLTSGCIHPIATKRIWATGTTATSILAVY